MPEPNEKDSALIGRLQELEREKVMRDLDDRFKSERRRILMFAVPLLATVVSLTSVFTFDFARRIAESEAEKAIKEALYEVVDVSSRSRDIEMQVKEARMSQAKLESELTELRTTVLALEKQITLLNDVLRSTRPGVQE